MTTALKNKRLSQNDRNTLYSFASKLIRDTQDSSELDAAYDAAAQAVHDAAVERFPQKDMQVLKRYDVATPDACVYISRGYGDYDRFQFRENDKRIPLRPGRSNGCNSRNPLLLDGEREEAYTAYTKASAAHETAIKQRYADYKALIFSAATFNEVCDVWPQAEQLRTAIVGTSSSLVVLSNDVVERIKADPAHQMAEAA